VGIFTLSIPSIVAVDAQDADPPGIVEGKDTVTAKSITPAAARGALFQELNPKLEATPERRAGYAEAMAASPNGKRLAIQTSGFPAYADAAGKLIPEASMEYVFLFDISAPTPVQLQVLALPNTFPGLAWSPASDRLFVSGGKDDTVVEFVDDHAHFARVGRFAWDTKAASARSRCLPTVVRLQEGSRSVRKASACSLPTFRMILYR
jgi:hypothetical protein